jgi:site-specific DNA-methyltransferase (adenine-specific)
MNPPKWSLKTVKIKDLKPHPKNPRRLTKDQAMHLANSLAECGLIDRPVVNQDMLIIGGHQRVKLLKKEGLKEIECMFPDRLLDETEVERTMIRLNRNHGEFDWDMLGNLFDPAELVGLGFTPKEMEICLDDVNPEDEEKGPKGKKKKECPNCGCQF